VNLIQAGARVVLLDVNQQALESSVKRLNANGKISCVSITGDVRQPSDFQAAIRLAKKQFGRFDILINNAGVLEPLGFPNYSLEITKRAVDINLLSVIIGTQLAVQQFQADKKKGIILNVSSAAGTIPVAMSPVYAATKAGVVNFTRSLAELAKEGIKVIAVAPTYVKTPMTLAMGEEMIKRQWTTAATPEAAADQIAATVGGWVQLSDISKTVLQLLMDESVAGGTVIKITTKGAYPWPRAASKL